MRGSFVLSRFNWYFCSAIWPIFAPIRIALHRLLLYIPFYLIVPLRLLSLSSVVFHLLFTVESPLVELKTDNYLL